MCYDHVTSHLTQSRIGELLKRIKITHEELARRIQATPETLKAIQDGRYDPPLSVAHKLAAALHVPVEKLFHDTEGRIHEWLGAFIEIHEVGRFRIRCRADGCARPLGMPPSQLSFRAFARP